MFRNLDKETKDIYMIAGVIGILGVSVILYKTRNKKWILIIHKTQRIF